MATPCFQIYPRECISDPVLARLTPADRDFCYGLLWRIWLDPSCSLPNDPAILGTYLGRSAEDVMGALERSRGFFEERDGRLTHPWLLRERNKQQTWREKSRLGGQKSSKQRSSSLAPERRSEIARRAARSRWGMPNQTSASNDPSVSCADAERCSTDANEHRTTLEHDAEPPFGSETKETTSMLNHPSASCSTLAVSSLQLPSSSDPEAFPEFVEAEKPKLLNDDEKTKPQTETAEARFQKLVDSRHNGTVNAWELMRTVREIVEPWGLLLGDFLDLDAKKTTNPRRIKSAEAYYTSLAQTLVETHRNALRGRGTHIQFAIEQEGAAWTGERCLGCGGTGRIGEGYCTHCALGRDLEMIGRRRAPKVTEEGEAA